MGRRHEMGKQSIVGSWERGKAKHEGMRDAGLQVGRSVGIGIWVGAKARRPWPQRGEVIEICDRYCWMCERDGIS